MPQYHVITMILVAIALGAVLLWQGQFPDPSDPTVDRVVGVQRFGDDPQESIRALCLASGEKVNARDALLRLDIRSGKRSFLVRTRHGDVEVVIVDGKTGPYFRTRSDDVTVNNLLNLPACL